MVQQYNPYIAAASVTHSLSTPSQIGDLHWGCCQFDAPPFSLAPHYTPTQHPPPPQVPALLLLPASSLGPSSLAGTPVDTLLNTCATYEWYTSQWIMAAAKERQPQQMTSFAAMHS
jgi:hypothetical protein